MRYRFNALSKMTCGILAAMLLVTPSIAAKGKKSRAADKPAAPPTEIFIRLVSVSHSANEVSFLMATFVPVSINYGGGGAIGPGRPRATEKKAGEEFTVRFILRQNSPVENKLSLI